MMKSICLVGDASRPYKFHSLLLTKSNINIKMKERFFIMEDFTNEEAPKSVKYESKKFVCCDDTIVVLIFYVFYAVFCKSKFCH